MNKIIDQTNTDITIATDKRRVVLRYAILLVMIGVIVYFLDGAPFHVLSTVSAWAIEAVLAAVLWARWAMPRMNARLELHGPMLTDTISRRTMQLDHLASVQHFADRNGEFMYLKDRQGMMLVIQMSYYSPRQLALLFQAIKPYVLAPTVEQKRAFGFMGATCDIWFNNYLKTYPPET